MPLPSPPASHYTFVFRKLENTYLNEKRKGEKDRQTVRVREKERKKEKIFYTSRLRIQPTPSFLIPAIISRCSSFKSLRLLISNPLKASALLRDAYLYSRITQFRVVTALHYFFLSSSAFDFVFLSPLIEVTLNEEKRRNHRESINCNFLRMANVVRNRQLTIKLILQNSSSYFLRIF